MASNRTWNTVWTACARLSGVPCLLGAALLLSTQGTANWIPSACVMLGCWVGLALALSGLFGLIALRRHQADEHLPWSRPTFYLGVAGILGSMIVGSASVLVLSAIETQG